MLIHGGKLKTQEPSTIFDLGKMRIVRKGKISRKEINDALKGAGK